MSGDPDLATTSKAIQILDQIGADVIELGVPYSVCSFQLMHLKLYKLYLTVKCAVHADLNIMQSHGILCCCKLYAALFTCIMYVCLESEAVM